MKRLTRSVPFRPLPYLFSALLTAAVTSSAADLDIGKTRRLLERRADTYSMPISPTGSAQYQCVTRRASLDDSGASTRSYRFVVELPDPGEPTDEALGKLPLLNLASEPRAFSLKPYDAHAKFNGVYVGRWKNDGSGISLYDYLYQASSLGKLYVETVAKPTFTGGSADAKWDEFRKSYDPAIMDEKGVAVSYSECSLKPAEPIFRFESIAGSVGAVLPATRADAVREIKSQFPDLDFRMLTPQSGGSLLDNVQQYELGFTAKGLQVERLTRHFATGASYRETFGVLMGKCAADVKARYPDRSVIKAWFCHRSSNGYSRNNRTGDTVYNQTALAVVIVRAGK